MIPILSSLHRDVVVQSLSHVQIFETPWTASCQASLSFTISWNLLKLMSIELVMPFNHLILIVSFSFHLQSFPTSGSLLIESCVFSILFSKLLIIFTIIILNSFSSSLPISFSFIWTSVFLVCAFTCVVLLCLFIIIF